MMMLKKIVEFLLKNKETIYGILTGIGLLLGISVLSNCTLLKGISELSYNKDQNNEYVVKCVGKC